MSLALKLVLSPLLVAQAVTTRRRALILPEADLKVACERAEAIRAEVETMRIRHLGQELPAVTVSIGVATFPQHGRDSEDLLQRADQALYRAKREGRNRVIAEAA